MTGALNASGRLTLTITSEPEPPVSVADIFGTVRKPLPEEDVITLLDNRIAIERLSAAQFGELAARNVDVIDAIGNSLF